MFGLNVEGKDPHELANACNAEIFKHFSKVKLNVIFCFRTPYTHLKKTLSLFCLLTGLNMVVLASLNSVVDRLEHGCTGQLEQCC